MKDATGPLGKHNVAAPTLAGLATNFGLSPPIDHPLHWDPMRGRA
jgi:hypothetical protein